MRSAESSRKKPFGTRKSGKMCVFGVETQCEMEINGDFFYVGWFQMKLLTQPFWISKKNVLNISKSIFLTEYIYPILKRLRGICYLSAKIKRHMMHQICSALHLLTS